MRVKIRARVRIRDLVSDDGEVEGDVVPGLDRVFQEEAVAVGLEGDVALHRQIVHTVERHTAL